MHKKLKEAIGIQDAMQNLESINNIDLDAPGPIGILKNTRIITNEEEFPAGEVEWVGAEGSEVLLEVLDGSYRAVHDYLVFLSKSPEVDWKSPRVLELVKRTVAIAAEAAHKMEKYLALRLGRPHAKINEREEFAEMRSYYERYFKVSQPTEDVDALAEKNWDKENDLFKIKVDAQRPAPESRKVTERPEYQAMHDFYQRQYSSEVLDSEPRDPSEIALKDMNEVRLDKDYELFSIRHEDGMPFYDLDILRNMRLECDFESDEGGFEVDPLLQVRTILDRDAGAAAGQILNDCSQQITDFYKVFKKLVNNDLASSLSCVCMSLYLSHNPRNLLQNSNGKTSLQYFEDFHQHLRNSMRTSEYQKLIAYPPEKSDKLASVLLNLVHSVSKNFFLRASGVKAESIGLIHRTARKGGATKNGKAHSMWNEFLLEDEAYRTLLSKFPSGPLLKTLDLIRGEAEESVPFDPIAQGNFPFRLFEVGAGASRIDFLHMPCPTRQSFISKAEILDEFRGLLRSYIAEELGGKHLLINLQDRTSWKELTRCNALEGMQKNAEFNKVLFVATIPKNTEFYHQNKHFDGINNAEEFMSYFMNQFQELEESGISLPTTFKQAELTLFAEKMSLFIHKHFFNSQKSLTRLEREDFIEIFDLFFSLKMIDLVNPASVSFTCKDAVDTGAAQTAAFYAFLKLLNDDFTKKEDHDMFRWLAYNPALFVRERAINQERLNRALSALQRLEAGLLENRKAITKEMAEFFNPQFLKKLDVKA